MMNENYNELEKQNSLNYDARIVKTVRNLKKMPSRQSSDSIPLNQDDTNYSKQRNNPNFPSDNVTRSLNDIPLYKNTNEYKKKRISIDGSGQSTSDSNKLEEAPQKDLQNLNLNKRFSKISNSTNKQLMTSSSKQIKFSNNNLIPSMLKTKSEFQKRLMNESSITKYKSMCVSILKDDEEIRKLCESANLLSNMATSNGFVLKENYNLEKFLDENFFSDKYFIYKLESLLESDVSKLKKEKFFKEEIKSFLGLKILDLQYESKLKSLDIRLENHLKNIENFNFFN